MKNITFCLLLLFMSSNTFSQFTPYSGDWMFTFQGDLFHLDVHFIFAGKIQLSLNSKKVEAGISHDGQIRGVIGDDGAFWGAAIDSINMEGEWKLGDLSGTWTAENSIVLDVPVPPSHPTSGCWDVGFTAYNPSIGFDNIMVADTIDETGFLNLKIPGTDYRIEAVGTYDWELFGLILDGDDQVCGSFRDEILYDEEPVGEYWLCTDDINDEMTGQWNATRTSPEVKITANTTTAIDDLVEICKGDTVILTAPDGGLAYEWSTGETTQSILVDKMGSYRVTMFHDCGSTLSRSMTVQFVSNPTIVVTPQQTIACEGADLIFDDMWFFGNCDLCSWQKDGEPIPGQWGSELKLTDIQKEDEGLYSFLVNIPESCWFDTLDMMELTVDELPDINFEQSGDTLIAVLSNNDDVMAYQWYLGDDWIPGAHNPTLIVEESGDYSLKIWTTNGCEMISEIYTVNISGLTEMIDLQNLMIIPNPVSPSRELVLQIAMQKSKPYTISILDALGREIWVREHYLQTGANQIILESPSNSGLYLIRIRNGNKSYTKKLLVD